MAKKRTAGVPPGIGLCFCPGVRLAVWDNTGNRVDPVPAASLCSVEGLLGLLGLLAEIHYLPHGSIPPLALFDFMICLHS